MPSAKPVDTPVTFHSKACKQLKVFAGKNVLQVTDHTVVATTTAEKSACKKAGLIEQEAKQ